METLVPSIAPIAILPGVGLLILSTSNRLLAVKQDIQRFTPDECSKMADQMKDELRRAHLLKNALNGLYLSVSFFAFAALLGALWTYGFNPAEIATNVFLALGVAGVCYASVLLVMEGLIFVDIMKRYARGGGRGESSS